MSVTSHKICPYCTLDYDADDHFCGKCGQALVDREENTPTDAGVEQQATHLLTAESVASTPSPPANSVAVSDPSIAMITGGSRLTPAPALSPSQIGQNQPRMTFRQFFMKRRLLIAIPLLLIVLIGATLLVTVQPFKTLKGDGVYHGAGSGTQGQGRQALSHKLATPGQDRAGAKQLQSGVTPTPTAVMSTPTPMPAATQVPIAPPAAAATQAPVIPTTAPQGPQSPAPGTLLYDENGSDNWSGWDQNKTADWSIQNGELVNNGSYTLGVDSPTIVAPYLVTSTNDYAVEATISLQSWSGSTNTVPTSDVGITLRGTPGSPWTGYMMQLYNYATFDGITQPSVYIENNQPHFKQANLTPGGANFNPGNGWHIYRLEVKGNHLSLYIDQQLVEQAYDTEFSTGGQVGLNDTTAQITVKEFKVTAL